METTEHRGQSKIGRLPVQLRRQVNLQLRDGVPYVRVIEWLKEQGVKETFNEQNVSNWFHSESGYRKWEREEQRLLEMQANREFAERLVADNDGTKIGQAALHIATSQIYQVLEEYDLDNLRTLLEVEPEQYANLVKALANLSKGSLDIQKYQEQVKIRKDAIQSELDKAKKAGTALSPETIANIEDQLRLL